MSETKRRVGRPRLDPSDRLPERILVSLKTEDYQELCRLSDEANLPTSGLVRLLITDWLEDQKGGRE